MDVPFLAWLAVLGVIGAALFADLFVFHRGAREIGMQEAVITSALWVSLGLGFAAVVWNVWGADRAGEYLAGYLIEKSLSLDNVFVFALLLSYFAVPRHYQHRVLFWGVVGALVLRGVFIAAGAVFLENFAWSIYVFGAILVVSGLRMARHKDTEIHPDRNPVVRALRRVVPITSEYRGQRFVLYQGGRLVATPLLVVLVAVESADIVFAVDSIPAVFAVTDEPFLVFTSNAFAILGLRALYFLLAGMMHRFVHLKSGLAAVLVFVGAKMFFTDIYHVPVWASLAAIGVILGVALGASLRARPAADGGSPSGSRDTDSAFALHRGGKICIAPRFEITDRDGLALAYTPGVGRVCQAIAEAPERARDLTMKQNSIAIVSDGSAVLGLGDIGPLAALPVMEGKAMLFKQLAGIDAYPICVRTHGVDELVAVGEMLEPTFGGINLEDVAAPGCFEAERRLAASLNIPVFHDDQHGTAVAVLAGLISAADVVGRRLGELRVVLLGVGAAGAACARLLVHAGIGNIVAVDRAGILHPGLGGLDPERRWVAANTNRDRLTGEIDDALRGADALIGLSGPRLIRPEWVSTMVEGAIVFALANPVPEILPAEVPGNVAVMATGRSDYLNQINNALVFPGFMRGLLDSRARAHTMGMKLAAAEAIAGLVAHDGVRPDHIVPSLFDPRVVPAVARAVAGEAIIRPQSAGTEAA